jgi:flagellar hook-basal body complex protein FliE
MDVKQAASAYNAIAGIIPNNAGSNTAATSTPNASFFDMVSQALNNGVEAGQKAEKVSTLALMGKADITDVAVAVSSAELALNTVVAIRDKVISAYQQILQMPM